MCYSMWRLGAIVRPAKKEQEFKYDFLCIFFMYIKNKEIGLTKILFVHYSNFPS